MEKGCKWVRAGLGIGFGLEWVRVEAKGSVVRTWLVSIARAFWPL